MIRPVRPLALLLLALLLLGCSGGDPEPPEQEFGPGPQMDESYPGFDLRAAHKNLARLWVGDDETPGSLESGRCFATMLVSNNTPDELRKAGILDTEYAVVPELPSFDREGAELWVDAQLACVDFVGESARAQVAATKGKVERAAYETCLREALTEDQLREAAVQSVMGDFGGDAVAALSRAQLDCVQQALPPD